MSKRPNNRFTIDQQNIDEPAYRKCAHHISSRNYLTNIKQYQNIVTDAANLIRSVDMDKPIVITMLFHFLAPRGSYSRERVQNRVHDIITSLNDDFNNYSTNANTMNNLRYKSIVNQVFLSNMPKQNIYLGPKYLEMLPTKPSNIVFQLGEIYYYPVRSKLNLSTFDDVRDVEIEHQVIGQFIHDHGAIAIKPENFLNVWVIDMTGTNIMGFSNFPWDTLSDYHGIVINRRCFFPEDYSEQNFCLYKTFTHEVGHYLGLLHVANNNNNQNQNIRAVGNINDDTDYVPVAFGGEKNTNMDDRNGDKMLVLTGSYDPADKNKNKFLHYEPDYNPLFMNFMDNSYDKYSTMFTNKQLQTMRHMILTLRPKLNSAIYKVKVSKPRYNPDTDTMANVASYKLLHMNPQLVPPTEPTNIDPRLAASIQSQMMPMMQPPIQQMSMMQPQMNMMQPQMNIMQQQQQPIQNISELVPSLSSGNVSTKKSPHDQLIANIQKNLPNLGTNNTGTTQSNYDALMKNFNAYNSTDGYARSYPFDPFVMQQYNQNMALINSQNQNNAPAPTQPIDPTMVNPNMINPNVINMYPNDPRLAAQAYQSIDPRLAQAYPNQNIDPRLAQAYPYQNIDPRIAQSYQNIDPRFAQAYPYQMDPRFLNALPRETAKSTKKKSTRTKRSASNKNDQVIEQMLNSEINFDAVKNINAYSKNIATMLPNSLNTSIIPPNDQNMIPANSVGQPSNTLLNLANRLNNISSQLTDIKAKLPTNNIPTKTTHPSQVPKPQNIPTNIKVGQPTYPTKSTAVKSTPSKIPLTQNIFTRNRPNTLTN